MIPQSPASLGNPTEPTAPSGSQQNLLQALIQRWLMSQGPNGAAPGSPYANSLGAKPPSMSASAPGSAMPPPAPPSMSAATPGTGLPPGAPPPGQSRFMNPPVGLGPTATPGAGAPPMGPPPSLPPSSGVSAPMGPPLPPPMMGPESTPQNDAQALGSPQSQGDIDPMLFNKTGVEDQSSQDQIPLDSQPIGGSSPLEQSLLSQQLSAPQRGPMTQVSHHSSGHGLGRIFKAIIGR